MNGKQANHDLPQSEQANCNVGRFVKIKELAQLINTPPFTIRKLVREGVLPAYRLTGRDYLFDPDEVLEVIKKMRVKP